MTKHNRMLPNGKKTAKTVLTTKHFFHEGLLQIHWHKRQENTCQNSIYNKGMFPHEGAFTNTDRVRIKTPGKLNDATPTTTPLIGVQTKSIGTAGYLRRGGGEWRRQPPDPSLALDQGKVRAIICHNYRPSLSLNDWGGDTRRIKA